MNQMNKLVKEIFVQNKNDKYLSSFVMEYLGDNFCDRCYNHTDETLTYVAAFKGRKNYNFKAKKGVDMEFKKYCKSCLWSKASKVPIYVEIPDNELVQF